MPKRLLTTIVFALLLGWTNTLTARQRQYQYWLDDDLAGWQTSFSEALSIDIADLQPGVHFLNVLCIGDDGTTNYCRYAFCKQSDGGHIGVSMPQVEYWLDDDYDKRQSTDAGAFAIDITAVMPGVHFLNVASTGIDGTRSNNRYAFYKSSEGDNDETLSYTYWIDDDISGSKTRNDEQMSIDVAYLTQGVHFFNALLTTQSGESSLCRKAFYIDKPEQLELCEFWLDDNYAAYNGMAYAADGKIVFGIDISGLDNGKHVFNYTARNVAGSWSAENAVVFVKRDKQPLAQGEWAAIVALRNALVGRGWKTPWNTDMGEEEVYAFDGLQVADGYVTGLDISDQGFVGELPQELYAFRKLEWLDVSQNKFTGNVGTLAVGIPSLTSLDVSRNCFADVYPMIPLSVTSFKASRQAIDRVVPLNLSEMKMEDIAATVPSILLYDHANQRYNTDIDMLCTTAESGTVGVDDWAMQLVVAGGKLTLPYVSPNNAYHGESGDVLNVFTMKSGVMDGSSFKVKMNFNQGDANFVQGVDATDLQATILYIFGGYRNYPFNFTAADTYRDNLLNVQDVICTVGILLAQTGAQASAPMRRAKGTIADSDAEAYIYMQEGKVILSSEKPVAAISIKANGDIEWELEQYGMMQTVSGGNVVGYSLGGMVLPAGETVLGTYIGSACINYASLADAEAQMVSVAFGENGETDIESVHEAFDGNIQLFDIAGRRVQHLNKGVNIIKNGNRTVKIVNK